MGVPGAVTFSDWLEKLILKLNIGTRKTSILLDGTHFEQW